MKILFAKWIVISVVSLLLISILYEITNFNNLFYSSLSEQFTTRQIEKYFILHKKWEWLSYIILPIFLLIKVTLTATILYIGSFFFNKNPIPLKQLWGLAINGEFLFLLVPFFKIIWFYFFQTAYKLTDIQYFYPLSAINITGYENIYPWYIYPLQTINIFEFAYIIYLSYQIGHLTKTNADTGLKIVSFSYIPALFLWITIVMFFTLNFS